MKVVILKVNGLSYIVSNIQCSNGSWFDAEGCFKYCNIGKTESLKKLQADKLRLTGTFAGYYKTDKNEEYWYKNKDNFIDVEIDIPNLEIDQTYYDNHKRM